MKKGEYQRKSLVEALELIKQRVKGMLSEEVRIEEALGRVVGHDLYASEELPHFSRVCRDGYALIARDSFGATRENPNRLEIAGELVAGEVAKDQLQPGMVFKVTAGGMLPPSADAVAIKEEVQVMDDKVVVIQRPYSPGENLIPIGSDLRVNQMVLPKGHLICPQDIGILAALGFENVYVVRQPRVAIICTGDELVGITEDLCPGKVRDLNTYALAAAVECIGGIPLPFGVVPDDPVQLRSVLEMAVVESDIVLISGGSLGGRRNDNQKLFEAMGEVLCSGIRVNPGKSALIAEINHKLVFGLPGYPVGAMVVFEFLVKPYMYQILNRIDEPKFYVQAGVEKEIPGKPGWDQYLPVRLVNRCGQYWSVPIPGETALISTLVQAAGLIKISSHGVKPGEMVEVISLSGGS